MKKLILIPLIALPLVLTGCISEVGEKLIMAESTSADSCKTRIMSAKVDIAKARASSAPTVVTLSQSNYVMMRAIDKLSDIAVIAIEANSNDQDIASCDKKVLALIQLESRRMDNQYKLGGQALSVTGLLGGAAILSDAGHSDGGSSSSTTISNSRVVSGSEGSSASGAGDLVNFPNTAGRDAAGGLQPRQLNGDGGGSNSGEGQDGEVDGPAIEPAL